MEIAFVYYSDDQGQTWSPFKEYGCLMGWFDFEGVVNGNCGVTPCDEPMVAETNDGRVLLFARSTVGRILYSCSRDDGKTWGAVKPTELTSSYSPSRLRRIPQTGDLICVWNQVSHAEIRRGYLRGRLSAAISRDSGATPGRTSKLSSLARGWRMSSASLPNILFDQCEPKTMSALYPMITRTSTILTSALPPTRSMSPTPGVGWHSKAGRPA